MSPINIRRRQGFLFREKSPQVPRAASSKLRLPFGCSRAGFGFIEVLISSVILMLVLAEMLGGFAGGRLLSRKSRDRLIALGFVREKMEELLATDYTLLSTTAEVQDTGFDSSYGNLEFVRRTGAKRYIRIDEFAYSGDSCYKRITVILKWSFLNPGVVYTEALTSLYYNPSYLMVSP